MTDQKEPEIFQHTLTIDELPPCTHSITNVGVTGYTNDPTLSPHKPPVIEDDRELIDRLMHQIVVRENDLYAALAVNERLKAVLRGYEQWEAALISRKGRGEMSEMVEGVARALAPSSWAALGTGDTVAHKNRRTASLRHARKAIEAMRDYTPVVYDANGEVAHQLVGHPKSVWIMLMDAALSTAKGGEK